MCVYISQNVQSGELLPFHTVRQLCWDNDLLAAFGTGTAIGIQL